MKKNNNKNALKQRGNKHKRITIKECRKETDSNIKSLVDKQRN